MVQLAGQSAPLCSTPIRSSSRPESEDDHLDVNTQSATKVCSAVYYILSPTLFAHNLILSSPSQQDDYTDGSISSSPILDAATTATEDPTFITAQGSSFFIGDGPGDTSSLSYNTDCQSKEDLAGSYRYTAAEATPPEVQPAGRSSPKGPFVFVRLKQKKKQFFNLDQAETVNVLS